jgi:hypothetical protein
VLDPEGPIREEKHEPASDIDTALMDSLKVLDPERPIREADIELDHAGIVMGCCGSIKTSSAA